jgi:hypothetical protein
MEPAGLFREKSPCEQRVLRVFRAEMIAREEANWRDLFARFDTLKVICPHLASQGVEIIRTTGAPFGRELIVY